MVLPTFGIKVVEINRRKTSDGEVISASRVRRLLAEGSVDKSLLKLVPESTYEYLISQSASSVLDKLKSLKAANYPDS